MKHPASIRSLIKHGVDEALIELVKEDLICIIEPRWLSHRFKLYWARVEKTAVKRVRKPYKPRTKTVRKSTTYNSLNKINAGTDCNISDLPNIVGDYVFDIKHSKLYTPKQFPYKSYQ